MSKSPRGSGSTSPRQSAAAVLAKNKESRAPADPPAAEDGDGEDAEQKKPTAIRSDPRADNMMKEAEKKLNRGMVSSLFSSGNKYEEALELILKAAAQYKVSKLWQQAGDAYVKAADISEKNLKEVNDAISRYVDAGKAYKNVNTKAAVKYFQISVDMYMELNRFGTAAKVWKDIAELYEKEMDLKSAQHAYQKAADCYDAEDSGANASAMHVKVAHIAAELEDYKKAIEIYEKVSQKALDGASAGRWGVKDHLFKALLCHLVMCAKEHKMDPMEDVINKYKDMLPQLEGTREIKLIEDLAKAFTDDDLDLFSDTVFRYDEIYKLDNWTAKVLLEIKNQLKNGPEQQESDFS